MKIFSKIALDSKKILLYTKSRSNMRGNDKMYTTYTKLNIYTGETSQVSERPLCSFEMINGYKIYSKDFQTFYFDCPVIEDIKRIKTELHWKYKIYKGVV